MLATHCVIVFLLENIILHFPTFECNLLEMQRIISNETDCYVILCWRVLFWFSTSACRASCQMRKQHHIPEDVMKNVGKSIYIMLTKRPTTKHYQGVCPTVQYDRNSCFREDAVVARITTSIRLSSFPPFLSCSIAISTCNINPPKQGKYPWRWSISRQTWLGFSKVANSC